MNPNAEAFLIVEEFNSLCFGVFLLCLKTLNLTCPFKAHDLKFGT